MPAPIDPIIAAQVMNMGDAGYSGAYAARTLGLPESTVSEIIHRHGRWGEVAEKPVFVELRRQQKVHLEAASRTLAAKCLVQAEQGLHKMSAYQAVGMYGILRQHERLDAGEPTEITASVNLHAIGSLDQLASKLSQVLLKRQETEGESTTVIAEESKADGPDNLR